MSYKSNTKSNIHISDKEINLLTHDVEVIINLLVNIDNKILNASIKDNSKLTNELFIIRKKIFNVNFRLHKLELLDNQNNNLKNLKNKIKFMIDNFRLINDFNRQILQKNKKKAIDTLTIVNTIFLPLSLITGYFGMNFKSMGVPSNKTGIFTIKNSQAFVFLLFISLTFLIIVLFYHNVLPQ
jgi:Mg2+ and Co2+ transporter CorA